MPPISLTKTQRPGNSISSALSLVPEFDSAVNLTGTVLCVLFKESEILYSLQFVYQKVEFKIMDSLDYSIRVDQTLVFDKVYISGQRLSQVDIAVLNGAASSIQHDVVVTIKECCKSENGVQLVVNLDLTKSQESAKQKGSSTILEATAMSIVKARHYVMINYASEYRAGLFWIVYPRGPGGLEKRFTRQNISRFRERIVALSCTDWEIGNAKIPGTNEVRHEPAQGKV